MKKLPVNGFCVLLLMFIGAGFVSSAPGQLAAQVQGTDEQVADVHAAYYEDHVAALLLSGSNCR